MAAAGLAVVIMITIAAALAAATGGRGAADTAVAAPPAIGHIEPAAAQGADVGMVCAEPAALHRHSLPGWDAEQLANAAVIVETGRRLGVPRRGWVVAVATAMQESSLRNLDYGDIMPDGRMSTSRGLFQQIAAWGPLAQRTDPAAAAVMFFTGGDGGQPGLLDIVAWQRLPITVAAQAVQQSGRPDAYARWEQPARTVIGYVTDHACPTTNHDDAGQTVVARALSQLGVPYAWGGGDATGPTRGISDGGVADAHGDYNKIGFDCSGLAVYAYAGIGVAVPHQTQAIWAAYPHITDRSALQPGDLLLYSANGAASGIHHVGIYLGGDRMVEAPQSGEVVQITDGIWTGWRAAQFIGAVRPGGTHV